MRFCKHCRGERARCDSVMVSACVATATTATCTRSRIHSPVIRAVVLDARAPADRRGIRSTRSTAPTVPATKPSDDDPAQLAFAT